MIRYTNKTAPHSTANAIHFAAIESLDEFRKRVERADVVWAVPSTDEGSQCIVYGSESIRDVLLTGPRQLKVVAFELDFGARATSWRRSKSYSATTSGTGRRSGATRRGPPRQFTNWGMGKTGGRPN